MQHTGERTVITRPESARRLLHEKVDVQVSESAVVAFSAIVEAYAADLADQIAHAFHERNERRTFQRIEPLRRLSGEHVEEGKRRLGDGH